MFQKPKPNPNFFEQEEAITNWWRENSVFEKSIENRADGKEYIFYDGPPFMSGMPHYAHLLSSILKDIIPRYQTMKGLKVERVWGWDCHGLPIENKVEAELGIKGKKDIEEYGLEKFIEKCYEWNRVGIENWRWYVEKIGRWVDLDNAYRTMDQDYMESVWWSFKQIWDKKLVYKGRRTSLYSTDFSTPVSDFEVSMDPDNYQDTEDIAVYVKFKLDKFSLKKLGIDEDKSAFLVAWTTTPWTLPSNFALAVNGGAEYSIVEVDGELIIVSKDRLNDVFEKCKKEFKEVKNISGNQLEGVRYEQLYSFLQGSENDFRVYLSEYVTTEDGTGVLHVAPAFGEADAQMGEEFGLSFLSDIDDEGHLTVGPWKGRYIRSANKDIRDDLSNSNTLLGDEKYVHRLPYYRGRNPLIYKTQEDIFINVQELKTKLIESNEEINWVPNHFKEGRFKYILETAPDWSISRSRSWGTSMPLWKSADGEEVAVGSREELMKLVNESGTEDKIRKVTLNLDANSVENYQDVREKLLSFISSNSYEVIISTNQDNLSNLREEFFGETKQESTVKLLKAGEFRNYFLFNDKDLNLHRPYIDYVKFKLNGKEFTRVNYTMDVWLDSGSMPFAQFHYPFEHKERFEESFPGDYISEYTGQIRAWFYVLHVLSNAIFQKPAFKNVLVSGVLAGTDGRKMSKSYGNYPDPKDTIIKYSGDALRLYFLNSPLVSANDMNFSEHDLKMQVREFLIPLWNIFSYLVTYSNIHNWSPREELAYNKRKVEDDSHPWDHLPFDSIDNELDQWILLKLQKTIKEVGEGLDNYTIPQSLRKIKELIDHTSKWYIRRSRDRFAEGDVRAIETLYYTLVEISKLLAPFAPFISEYIYRELVGKEFNSLPESVHLTDFPQHDERLIGEYSAIEGEMEIVQRISEMGQTLRTTNNIKLRQPLSTMYYNSQNENAPTLSEWMARLISSELNIKDVVEKLDLQESDEIKVGEDQSLKIKIGLDLKINPELLEEGTVREIIRTIQATRKKKGFQQGEKVSVQYYTEDESLNNLIAKNIEKLSESVGASKIVSASNTESADFNDHKINDSNLKLNLSK